MLYLYHRVFLKGIQHRMHQNSVERAEAKKISARVSAIRANHNPYHNPYQNPYHDYYYDYYYIVGELCIG
jgi:hypothetical protein